MIELSDEQIDHIAGELNAGLDCYIHRETGEIVTLPDEEDLWMYGSNPWQETIDEIESNEKEYIHIRQMNSNESYGIMEDFASQLEDGDLKYRLFKALNRRKPFRNFKDIIDHSDYRQDWFDFNHEAQVRWVMNRWDRYRDE